MGFPAVLLIIAGAVLLAVGIWPLRRGDTPYCSQCGYDLTNLLSQRCPECGSKLRPTTVVHGKTRRRPIPAIAGLLFVTLGLALALTSLREVRWRSFLPSSWLVSNLDSRDRTVARNARWELTRRIKASALSEDARTQLVETLLRQITSSPPRDIVPLSDLLDQCFVIGLLSPKQTEIILQHLTTVEFHVRSAVGPGDPVPCQTKCMLSLASGQFWIQFAEDEYLLDGELIRHDIVVARPGYTPDGLCYPNAVQLLPPPAPGRHVVRVRGSLKVFGWPRSSRRTLYYQEKISLEQEFDVLDTEPSDYITVVANEGLCRTLQASISPTHLIWGHEGKKGLLYCFTWRDLPVNCAFGVYARLEGKEHYLGPLTLRTHSDSGGYHDYWTDAPKVTSVDIILRSSPARARRTIDLFEVWEGELVYEDLQVRTEEGQLVE